LSRGGSAGGPVEAPGAATPKGRLFWLRVREEARELAGWERRALERARREGYEPRLHELSGQVRESRYGLPPQRPEDEGLGSPEEELAAGVPRGGHLGALLRVWILLALGEHGRAVATNAQRAIRHLRTAVKHLIPALREGPRALLRLWRGAETSVDPLSPSLRAAWMLLETEPPRGDDRLVLVGDSVELIQLVIHARGVETPLPGRVAVVLCQGRLDDDERARFGRLPKSLGVLTGFPAWYVFGVAGEARTGLEEFLGRCVEDVAELPRRLFEGGDTERARPMGRHPVAVVVRTPWVMCGSTILFANQTEYLLERGYFVMEVVINDLTPPRDPESAWKDFQADNRLSRAHVTVLLNLSVRPWTWLRMLLSEPGALRRGRLARRAAVLQRVDLPETMNRICQRIRPHLAIVNHCFNIPVTQTLFPDTPIVLETQDVQAAQLELQVEANGGGGRPSKFDVELAEELRLARCAQALVSVNQEETEFFVGREGLGPIATIHPYLIDGPRHEHSTGANAEMIDVLLVASDNAGNVDSVRWLMKEIAPRLERAGVEVTVIGNVNRAIAQEAPNVRFLGRVKDVGSYYEHARLVVLPVTEGTGISIKTMEALTLGKPVVATSHALRGVPQGERELPTFDEAEEFSREVCRLLRDAAARAARAAEARRLAERHFSKKEYFRRWDRVLSEVLGVPDELGGLP